MYGDLPTHYTITLIPDLSHFYWGVGGRKGEKEERGESKRPKIICTVLQMGVALKWGILTTLMFCFVFCLPFPPTPCLSECKLRISCMQGRGFSVELHP